MARDPVVKTEILCHIAERKKVLSVMEKTGRIHLLDMSIVEDVPLSSASEEGSRLTADLMSSLEKAIGFLKGKESEKETQQVMNIDSLNDLLSDRDLSDTVSRCAYIADEISRLSSQIQEQERQKAFLEQWQDIPVSFSEMNREGVFSVRAGRITAREGLASLESLEAENELFHYQELSENRVLVLWHSSAEENILQRLSESGFAFEDFSAYSDSPASTLKHITEQLAAIEKKIAVLNKEADTMVSLLPSMKALYDAAGIESFRAGAVSSGRESRSATLLHAWIRRSDMPSLKNALESIGPVELTEIEPDEGETPPVFLSESATADPYLMLTDMYGRPQGADPDPTPLMAPFYAMFFGVCIGDAGYGLALAAGTAIGWHFTRRKSGNTRLFRLLFQGALASIFWGVLLGGWFGASFSSLPGFLQAAAMPLNSIVPGYSHGGDGFSISNQFLYLTLGFGVIQLAWGIIVNLQKRLRAEEGIAAVVDQTGWILALLGLFPWLFDHYLVNIYSNTGILDSVFLGMLGLGAVLIFVMGGREAAGIGGRIGLGAYACYGIVNLLGDVLSYSRLFALALSSAIIASVINQIAAMVSGSIPVIGIILAVLVLAGGHLFNLAMAVLSGFIHTARLQFVEFFGKFYDGTGKRFTPFRYEPRYVRINREQSNNA
ncbi:hypothetical protein CSA37_07150 [Candidatus Fermentibacteria bacterium]|nr:MAG: hypothetical protein CSA37_10045 [Candidatus Fermentibacteria bacterium]PIE52334.1 MAG: hypothetical protein CSA37_07150 [Candidatus Fermentibacteria bacterium]